ncbi:MAG: T9SS type A sorting domain-containing protein, partial [Bacteroidales bacterium]|nr:T9SS type A sorting domain-containing protein [Bacteroidales bacterium]
LNYQWNLLSDLCYFSYEVDPSTGEAVTIHEWLTDPAIDSAQANGTRIHLCATIFSGHTGFFTNPAARQTLINNLISLVQQRNANGINMDIEALPSSMSDSVNVFMRELSIQLKNVLPEAKISLCLPAVNWNNDFQIDSLSNWVDWFFIMGYDYYWSGSDEAGPVSPLYSLTPGYNYSLARTISAYETAGLEKEKFILGVPYYGRQWKTVSNSIPSQKLANGTAVTYANVRNNGSIYNSTHYTWEPNSFSSCYIFFQNNNWNQCFIGLDRDLRKKYDIVNYRNLAGIGIWALGYDEGYTELWQAISDKFTDCYTPLIYDTIFDSGGPAWNYYFSEDYIMTIDHGFNDVRYLSFSDFSAEDGYDSLWIYAGPDTTSTFLGGYTGQTVPGNLTSDNGTFTLRFRSDGLNNALGWRAVYHDGSLGTNDVENENDFIIYPNPAKNDIKIFLPSEFDAGIVIVYDISGRVVYKGEITGQYEDKLYRLNISAWPAGSYTVVLITCQGELKYSRFFII